MALGVVNGPGSGFPVHVWEIILVLVATFMTGWLLRGQNEKSTHNPVSRL